MYLTCWNSCYGKVKYSKLRLFNVKIGIDSFIIDTKIIPSLIPISTDFNKYLNFWKGKCCHCL